MLADTRWRLAFLPSRGASVHFMNEYVANCTVRKGER
jgi:hypothetical protein